MSNDLIVGCNSIDGTVTLSSNVGTLSKLTWDIYEENMGFTVENSDCLMDVYCEIFYILDEAASVQFIINMAEMIRKDQDLDKIVYCNSEGKVISLPPFIPNTLADEELYELPKQQIALCKAWSIFQENFGGYLCVEFLDDLLPSDLRVGFIDLVNMELSLIVKKGHKNG